MTTEEKELIENFSKFEIEPTSVMLAITKLKSTIIMDDKMEQERAFQATKNGALVVQKGTQVGDHILIGRKVQLGLININNELKLGHLNPNYNIIVLPAYNVKFMFPDNYKAPFVQEIEGTVN